jgi:hypothetical protein
MPLHLSAVRQTAGFLLPTQQFIPAKTSIVNIHFIPTETLVLIAHVPIGISGALAGSKIFLK